MRNILQSLKIATVLSSVSVVEIKCYNTKRCENFRDEQGKPDARIAEYLRHKDKCRNKEHDSAQEGKYD